MFIRMFVHTDIKRKLPLPNSASWGNSNFPSQRQGWWCHRPEHEPDSGWGRKGSSILINLSFESMPLINTCKCSVCCVFPAFTRETFWFKADLEGFPCHQRSSSKVRRQLKCTHFKERVRSESIHSSRERGYSLIPVLCGHYYCITV